MFKLLLLGLSTIGHAAVGSAHVCHCADHAPHVPDHLLMGAVGYGILTLISAVLLALHLIVGPPPGPGTDCHV